MPQYLVIPRHVKCACNPDRHSKNAYEKWHGQVIEMPDKVDAIVGTNLATSLQILRQRVEKHLSQYVDVLDKKIAVSDFELVYGTQEIGPDGDVCCDPRSRNSSVQLTNP
jgi:hypothetical protein